MLLRRWEDGWVRLDQPQVKHLVNWKTLSCALLIWDMDQRWDSAEAKALAKDLRIFNLDMALAAIDIVLQPRHCSRQIPVIVF